MSNEVPPVPQAPQAPQPPYTAPQPPVPPKKKGLPALAWVGIGCAVIVLLTVIGLVALGGYAVHKVKQAGFDPALWKKNPTAAAAKIVTTMNPDVEVVSTDNDSQTITLRNKKTGKTVTVDLQDIKDGKFRFFDDKGKESTISIDTGSDKKGEESGTMNIKTSEGNLNISTGSNASKLPKWVPLYKDIVPQHVMVMSADKGTTGGYSIVVQDSVEIAAALMEKELKDNGFAVSKNSYTMNDKKMVNMSGQKGGNVSINVIVTNTDEGTGINITFSEKFGS
ncbi:MAG: hypothetical protein CO090_01605 [Acidobacteria bacterium CG_4_9_14_3_um_filter_49_7]|nr:MAG: hypothetical protein CO090_01605 [Acidobacteria bacterium CG_4_9_14_3_um_filter_49_7]